MKLQHIILVCIYYFVCLISIIVISLSVNHAYFNSLSTRSFANSLDPDQAQQNVGPGIVRNCLTLSCDILEIIFLKR